jgi:hypothetical protein
MMILALSSLATAQSSVVRPDTYTLLTMPYNQRPLTLYKGQLQVNAGYKFSVMARQFNSDGQIEILRDMGIASVYHYYFGELKYGVTSFLELSAQTNYMKRGVRSQTVTFVSANETIKVNSLTEEKGLGDLLIIASLRLPFEFRVADLGISGGLFIPSAEHEPQQPTHNVSNVLSESAYTINYQYHNKIGEGVPVYFISARVKATLSGFSLEASFTLRDPLREGENIRWDQSITENRSFDYAATKYKYLPDRTYDISTAFHYQAAGWLNAAVNLNYIRSEAGWTEYWDKKYRNPEKSMLAIEPGLEIQVSPAITIYQKAGFPVSGKNMHAPFYMYITASFNRFPFFR